MIINKNEKIWSEKYRPSTIDDLIIDDSTKTVVKEWIANNEIPNLGLFGATPGTGKTSLARSLVNDIDGELIHINASNENGIDVIRNKLSRFASTTSFNGKQRVALLDEADGLTQASQESLRAFIEEYSQNCRFIITGNYRNKIIEPLLNRLNNIDFDDIFYTHKKALAHQILERCEFVLKSEGVTYNVEDIKQIIKKTYPSLRGAIVELHLNTKQGKLDINLDTLMPTTQYTQIINALASKNYNECMKAVKRLNDPKSFYDYLFQNINTAFKDEGTSIADAIMVIHQFLVDFDRVRDPEISLSAFCAVVLSKPTIIINTIS